MTATSPWVMRPRPNPAAGLRLFCFPFAGGGASVFRRWAHGVPPALEVCPVQLPGRETRFRDPAFTGMKPLIETLARELVPFLDRPFGFFGHSMGALVGFELARHLRRQTGPQPAVLVIASRRAPQIGRLDTDEPPMHTLSDAGFQERVRRFNGTPEAILNNAELFELLMPMFRADFTVVETYAYAEEPPLAIPITAFGGVEDRGVSREQLEAWQQQTAAAFRLRMMPGGHFFFQAEEALFLHALSEELAPWLGAAAPAP
jgi:medium-chain acyl-[acyl-carrier-protein] hydrolase